MNKTRKRISNLIFFLFVSIPVFAQSALPGGMQTLAENILDIFTSPFVKVILAIFLCGSAIAYAFNKDNDKIKRNAIAIAISAGILVVATEVVDKIWAASGG